MSNTLPRAALDKVEADLRRGDRLTALESLQSLVAVDYASAGAIIAAIYARGEGEIERDFDKARYWAERAFSEAKSPVAAALLAKMHVSGSGGPIDYEKAFFYYSEVEKWDLWPGALLRLGMMYELGRGTEIDLEHARMLYRRSARLGNVFARKHWGVLEIKRGKAIRGILLWGSAIIQGYLLALISPNPKRLETY